MSSGNKYHRQIDDLFSDGFVTADVYQIIEGFDVRCPARQHAIKKLLCAGIREKGDSRQDLSEARDAVTRAMELEDKRHQKSERPK